jgi:hypothetical protein
VLIFQLYLFQITLEDVALLEPWLDWAADYARFFMACLKRWVRTRQAAEAAATRAQPDQAAAAADALPGARLLCDGYFFKSLGEVGHLLRSLLCRTHQICRVVLGCVAHHAGLQ